MTIKEALAQKLGQELLRARSAKQYTQGQVAESVSISDRWYQYLESGTELPGSITLMRLIVLLEMDMTIFREEVCLVPICPR